MKTITKNIIDSFHFEAKKGYLEDKLSHIALIQWHDGKTHRYYSHLIDDLELSTNPNIIEDKLKESLAEQLFAPVAKTKFGKWLFKCLSKII